MNVLHIINSLNVGGAENALVNLVRVDPDRKRHRVVSLTGTGAFADQLEAMGIAVFPLDFRRPARAPGEFVRLVKLLRADRPDLVQTWMYHADIIGGLACRMAGSRIPLVWGVRLAEVRVAGVKRRTRGLVYLAGLLSRWLPDAIIANAERSIASHASYGYVTAKFRVIGNGFDTDRFRPDPERRNALREQLGIGADTLVAGLVGRYSAQKNQDGFLAAAGNAARDLPQLSFLLCGRDISEAEPTIAALIERHGLSGRIHLLPERTDTENVFAALDLYVSASRAEGFPNVVAEAMACGLPCIVTDVGNCRDLVGDAGLVCPPGDTAGLAAALVRLTQVPAEERAAIGHRARAKIQTQYSRERMLAGFEHVWSEAAQAVTAPPD